MRGWHAKTAILQGRIKANTNYEDWWAGGTGPMLIIAGLSDTIAPEQDAIDLLETEFPDRVMAVRVEAAGHALLPEQPEHS